MAEDKSLHDAFIDELRDLYDAEKQIAKSLPKMAKAASSPELKQAFKRHLEETQEQIGRLEQVFESLDERARGKHCAGMAGILEEGKDIMKEDFEERTMDAALIAAAQRVEHYEMAAYGTLVAWGNAIGQEDIVELLQTTLDEEKATDDALTQLAEAGINEAATAEEAEPREERVLAGAGQGRARAADRGTRASAGRKRQARGGAARGKGRR
ncbi:MAG: ferritin-like domain-containing protein [Vicinamibacterales bacterium]